MVDIEPEYKERMNLLAQILDEALEGAAFVLVVYGDKRMNYISNCEREDVILSMREFVARSDGRLMDGTDTAQ